MELVASKTFKLLIATLAVAKTDTFQKCKPSIKCQKWVLTLWHTVLHFFLKFLVPLAHIPNIIQLLESPIPTTTTNQKTKNKNYKKLQKMPHLKKSPIFQYMPNFQKNNIFSKDMPHFHKNYLF